MQGAPEHGPRPGPLLPEACSAALGQSEDPVAAELANAGEGAVPPDHQLPLARMCVGAAGTVRCPSPWEPRHSELSGCGGRRSFISLSAFGDFMS